MARQGRCTMTDPIETGRRKGDLLRIVHDRNVKCHCLTCARLFVSTGAATAHARTARHRVHVSYAATFTYVPAEQHQPPPPGGDAA